MMDEQQLRERLGTVEVPPTRLQVSDLVDAGRRRVLRRRGIRAGCAVALATGVLVAVPSLVFGSGGSAPAQPADTRKGAVSCDVTRLPAPAGLQSITAAGVDPTGTYVIGNSITGQRESGSVKSGTVHLVAPILWVNGQPQALPVQGKSTSAAAVNAGGVVAAVAGDEQWTSVVRYVDGVPEKLTPPAGNWIYLGYLSINAKGDVLVNARHQTDPEGKGIVLLWKAGAQKATQLPLPANAEGLEILDNGTIVGDILKGPKINDLSSYAWNQQGVGHKLKTPAGQSGGVNAARGDWATGNLWPSGTAARWNLRTGAVTDLGIHAPASAINAGGWIITDGTLQRDGRSLTLVTSVGVPGEPVDVSDNGVVVGSILSSDKDGAVVRGGALTWQCGS